MICWLGDDQDKHDLARGEDPDHADAKQEVVELGNVVSGVHVNQHQQLGHQKQGLLEPVPLCNFPSVCLSVT